MIENKDYGFRAIEMFMWGIQFLKKTPKSERKEIMRIIQKKIDEVLMEELEDKKEN